MPDIHTAMVFAAGLGKRMRPITNELPKPLIKVAGKTMLDRALDKLAEGGVTKAVVNKHHLAGQIEAHVKARLAKGCKPDIVLSQEDMLLETGGGIVRALPHLNEDAIYTINSDIIWENGKEPALKRLTDMWEPDKMDALLLLQPLEAAIGYDGPGNFDIGAHGQLIKAEGKDLRYVYTGVQILKPSLFRGMKEEPFSLNVLYKNALQPDGKLNRIYGLVHDGKWFHVGEPASIELVESELTN